MNKGRRIIDSHTKDLQNLCRKYGVLKLWVFGSVSKGTWTAGQSDFDFAVVFGVPPENMRSLLQLTGFQSEAEKLLGAKVDIVEWAAAKNPFFRREVERTRVELYAA